jgi:CspA family cold shock protein
MTDFGTIKSYDTGNGAGTITPEKGGDALPFRKSALQQQGQEPKQHQRYTYDVKNGDDGNRYAVNMQAQGEAQSQKAPGSSNILKEQASKQQG